MYFCFELYISVRATGEFYGISEGVLLQSIAGCNEQVINTDYENDDGSFSAIYTMEDGANFWMANEDDDKREKVVVPLSFHCLLHLLIPNLSVIFFRRSGVFGFLRATSYFFALTASTPEAAT